VGRKAGLSDENLRTVLGDDRTPFNDTERLVIELADTMTDIPSTVSDDLYAWLRDIFFEEQLMQLGAQIAFENYRARWNRIFNVESDNLYHGTTTSQSGTKPRDGLFLAPKALSHA
jgi:alkylhydroperoxidase family enzyme